MKGALKLFNIEKIKKKRDKNRKGGKVRIIINIIFDNRKGAKFLLTLLLLSNMVLPLPVA